MTASRPPLLRLRAQLELSPDLRKLRRQVRASPGGRPTRAAGNQRLRTAGSQQCGASPRAFAAGNRGGASCHNYMDAAAVSQVLTRNAFCMCTRPQVLHGRPLRARTPAPVRSRDFDEEPHVDSRSAVLDH